MPLSTSATMAASAASASLPLAMNRHARALGKGQAPSTRSGFWHWRASRPLERRSPPPQSPSPRRPAGRQAAHAGHAPLARSPRGGIPAPRATAGACDDARPRTRMISCPAAKHGIPPTTSHDREFLAIGDNDGRDEASGRLRQLIQIKGDQPVARLDPFRPLGDMRGIPRPQAPPYPIRHASGFPRHPRHAR